MYKSVEGISATHIELLDPPPEWAAGPVSVTFLSVAVSVPERVDLAAHGIGPEQAADLRRRLTAFAEDSNRPEINIYDAL